MRTREYWPFVISGLTFTVLLSMVLCCIYRIRTMIRLRSNHEIDQGIYLKKGSAEVSSKVVEEEMRMINDVMDGLHFKEPTDKLMYITTVCNGTDRFKSHPLEV